jgi:DNA repair exonuclease SbcCD ATPase subunit
MVLYICNKCNKNFSRKQSYQAHINRKYSCILTENFNTNLELEENNKQYEENNKELTEKNKLYEDKIKQLEDRINNLENDKKLYKENNKQLEDKINNLESVNKTLNNLLDKFIKTNNKNTKDNNDDIKIKMTEGYVYIIRECDFVRLNENIYKIGRTAKINPEDRFQKYRSKANYENL